MLAILYIHQAMLMFPLIVLAVLLLLYFNDILQQYSRQRRISRLIICKCKSCNLVFVASRFFNGRRIHCPRCDSENPVEHRKYQS